MLSSGLNYAIPHRSIPVCKILASAKCFSRKLDQQTAQALYEMVKSCLPNTTRTKPNLDQKQRTALKQFREDNSIVILPADKGNMTLVMKRNGYRGKMEAVCL